MDTEVQEYEVNLSALTNLLNVNISNSDVTNIILPNSSLRTLSVKGSKINAFRLIDQNRISSIDLGGCSKLNTIVISRCPAMQELVISDLNVLTTLEISDCVSLSSVTIYNCNSLSAITITGNDSLETLNISDVLSNGDLVIKVLGGILSSITISQTNCTKIVLPSEANLSHVETLNLANNIYLTAVTIGTEEVPTYKNEPIFDFSGMPSLKTFSLRNVYKLKYLRLLNDEAKPFELAIDSLYGCTGIERIFGHLLVNKSSTFSGLIYYRIRDWAKTYEDYTSGEWENVWNSNIFDFDEGDTATNLTFDSTAETINLQYCFSRTNCDILDLIYVFKRLNQKVTNINYLFNFCSMMTVFEKSLPVELFTNCTGVKTATGLFSYCSGINTKISSEMLAPIMGENGLTSFDGLFTEVSVFVEYNKVLFPSGNSITSITSFNPIYYELDSETGEPVAYDVDPLNILSNLTELERITSSFNNIIFLGLGADREFKLFYGIKKLEVIIDSFNFFTCEVYGGENDFIRNIFGKDTSDYPSLVIVNGSFNNSAIGLKAKIGIGNTFFGNSRNSLESFSSNFSEVDKQIDFDDCGNYTFPYEILAGCRNLITCHKLFKDTDCTYDGGINTGVTLPNYIDESGNTVSMFEDCVSLRDIPSFFNGMSNIKYTLSGGGFKNCQLEDISSIFDNAKYKAMEGGIPFKMFYQCDESGCVSNTITNMSNAFRGCSSSAGTCYAFDGLDTDLFENYRDDNNQIRLRWNRYAFDGCRDFYSRKFRTSSGEEKTLQQIKRITTWEKYLLNSLRVI